MDIFIPYGTVSSVVFTIFGKNFRQSDRAQRRPGQLIYCRTEKRCFRRFSSLSGH
jgi:hypothetical protein